MGRHVRRRTPAAAGAIAGLILAGCVRTVYLPADAAAYKAELEATRAKLEACEKDLDMVLKDGERLRRDCD